MMPTSIVRWGLVITQENSAKGFLPKIFKQVSDRPALPPRLVLAFTSHDSLLRFFLENLKTDD